MHTTPTPGADGDATALMPKFPASTKAPGFNHIDGDFIPHPAQFPLRFRRRPTLPWLNRAGARSGGDIGLSFIADRYVAAGSRLDVEIPLRGQVQRFRTRVVMVREVDHGFELGLWFANRDDALRARIVEQICHTECYLRSRHPQPH